VGERIGTNAGLPCLRLRSNNGAPALSADLSSFRDNWGAGDLDFTTNIGSGAVTDAQALNVIGKAGIITYGSGQTIQVGLPEGTAANQVLKWDGSNWTPQAESTGGGSLSTFNAVGDRGIEVSEDGANWNNGPVTIEDGETLSVRPSEEVPFMRNFYVTEEHSNIESGDESPQDWPSSLGTTRWCRQVDENGQYPPGTDWSSAPADGLVWTWGGHQKGITIEGGADAQESAWMVTCFRTERGIAPEGGFKSDHVW
jgi:hypothetical protein